MDPVVLGAVAVTVESTAATVSDGVGRVEPASENLVVGLRGWSAAGRVEVVTGSWRTDLAGSGGVGARFDVAGSGGLSGRLDGFGAALVHAALGYIAEDEVSAGLFTALAR